MRHLVTYPHPPASEDQDVPKFEVFIDWSTYTWRCEVADAFEEYDGTFSIVQLTQLIHLEWYEMPANLALWEEVEFELRSIILTQLR